MEVGYLTAGGELVQVDTLGFRQIFAAYRIDPQAETFRFLAREWTMERVADVHVAVTFHRQGWAARGEPFLRRTPARLYRVGDRFLLIGQTWKRIRIARRGNRIHVWRPLGASLPKITKAHGIAPPPRGASFVVLLDRDGVRGQRRTGTSLDLYGVERREFLDLRVGKLTATLEFPAEAAAEAFARQFPATADLPALDRAVPLDVDRRKGIVWNRKAVGLAIGLVLAYAWGIGLAAYVYLIGRNDHLLRAVSGVWGFTFFVWWYVPDVLWDLRRDLNDFVAKWQEVPRRRWAEGGKGRVARFLEAMREQGLELRPDAEGLAALDRFFLALPSETYFHAFALDAGAFVGAALMERLYQDVPYEWRYLPDYGDAVLWIDEIEFWAAPATILAKVWEGKQATTLAAKVDRQVEMIETRLAFRDVAAFSALGFRDANWDGFEDFAEALRSDLREEAPDERRLGDRLYRTRTVLYEEFEVHYVELKHGATFRPFLAIPFFADAKSVRAAAHTSAPASPLREDVAILHLGARDDLLGVQILNFLAVGRTFERWTRPFEIDLVAVAEDAKVVPRGAEPGIAPKETGGGVPTVPRAQFLGRVAEVEERVNSFSDVEFWRLELDISGFPLDVVVRQDRCDGTPKRGDHVAGTCWLIAQFPTEGE